MTFFTNSNTIRNPIGAEAIFEEQESPQHYKKSDRGSRFSKIKNRHNTIRNPIGAEAIFQDQESPQHYKKSDRGSRFSKIKNRHIISPIIQACHITAKYCIKTAF